ncbi:MAG: DEAD/DEAH box helicase [Provencibacterium sp.]|jgi:ATP-dependent RNA helicase DeaD|nr:DEAD/DEAH box helicase [Provencibacterium sp.]
MNNVLFSELSLSEPLARAVGEMGFESATEIQARAIPLLRAGADVIGRSQTGTGKTLAFGIPAVEGIDTGENKGQVQVLILCPTRELCMQACGEIRKLAKYKPGVKTVDIYGGAPMNRQIMALRSGANIVVGTPGRVMDHLRRRTLRLEHLRMVVLDEADEMLSMGFKEDIETILTGTPESRQTVLFSATMPPAIMALTGEFQREAQLVEVDKKQPSVKSIRQAYCEVPASRKQDALCLLLYAKNPQRAIVFCNTKAMTEELAENLRKRGMDAQGLNGDMKQPQRTQVMNGFKSGQVRILVATDVAARGIDVSDVDIVLNYDLPQDMEYYLHRIGRTGRAGKEGCALTFCTGRRQAQQLLEFARMTRSELQREKLPSVQQAAQKLEEGYACEIKEALLAGQQQPGGRLLEALEAAGYTPQQVASAALTLLYGGRQLQMDDIEELPAPRQAAPRRREMMGQVALNLGKKDCIAPNHIVGAIAELTDLAGSEIGKIEIFDSRTLVGIPRAAVQQVVERLRGKKILGRRVEASIWGERPARERRQEKGRGARPLQGKRQAAGERKRNRSFQEE